MPLLRLASAVALTLVATISLAQAPDLTERYVGDGWSVSHPAGWIVNVQALPALATDEAALATMQRNAPLPAGGITIGIIPPSMYGAIGLTPSTAAADAIQEIAAFFGGAGMVTEFPVEGVAAFIRPLEGTTRVPPMTQLVVAEVAGGVVAFLVVAEDFVGATPLVQAIVASFSVP